MAYQLTLWRFLKGFGASVIAGLYPPSCILCIRKPIPELFLCSVCSQAISPVVSLALPVTERKPALLYAAAAYDGPLVRLIHKKFSSDLRAAQALAAIIINSKIIEHAQPDYFVPVPLHWRRYAARGYNQAVEIARCLARHYNIPMAPLLIRRRKTVFQKDLSSLDRYRNVQEAFVLHPWYRRCVGQGRRIMLVDDLCTTGATLMSCMKVLQGIRPERLSAVVAARAIK